MKLTGTDLSAASAVMHPLAPHTPSQGAPSRRVAGVLFLCGVAALLGCSDLSRLAGNQQLPAGVPDPSTLNTPAGALEFYSTVLANFGQSVGADSVGSPLATTTSTSGGAVVDVSLATGLISDELSSGDLGGSAAVYPDAVSATTFFMDARQMPEQSLGSLTPDPAPMATTAYNDLQEVRAWSNLAIGALATYDSSADPALRGMMYALQGYSEILLGELFCSGVPLSTMNFQGDYTYQAGSTTQEVFQAAVTALDSALALSVDSVNTLNLARVGLGRALLDLGEYAQAGQAVAAVPDAFAWDVAVQWTTTTTNLFSGGLGSGVLLTVSDRKGGTGLPYISSGDPRTAVVANGTNNYGVPQFFPAKYGTPTATTPLVVASGLEARLIQAEAALQAGDAGTWIGDLNQLRTSSSYSISTPAKTIFDTAWVTGCDTASDGCVDSVPAGTNYAGFAVDSVFYVTVAQGSPAWNVCWGDAGSTEVDCNDPIPVVVYSSGGVSGLGLLTDPGTATARDSLMFTERAYWLFLTGHRLGDMRRQLVQGGSGTQETVFPTGIYPGFVPQSYGTDVNAPIPAAEYHNPHFTGCLSRNE